ncbi:unnamed protein product [Peronospora destructor]|uniref:CCHC-type domain-containing protein n=1 Tax=Peronospora destructor TaxID=86335 RepID=A0AAV0UJW0_9STRA|nr:unnamed protein product [Peronospora destructor]
MTKITTFMRVTKQPKAHDKKVHASSIVMKQRVDVVNEKKTTGQSDDESRAHIPTFIYETIKYKHKHKKHEVSKEMQTILKYIKNFYDVPKDIEQNAKFGCHSGLTYEKRVARAYSMGQLPSKREKTGGAEPKPICLTCATVGHTYKSCPKGF